MREIRFMWRSVMLGAALISIAGCSSSQTSTDNKNSTGASSSRLEQCGEMGDSICEIGAIGPGGGIVFYVDVQNRFPAFDYLEVAPDDASPGSVFTTADPGCGISGLEDCQKTWITTAEDARNFTEIGKGLLATTRIQDREIAGGVFGTFAANEALNYETQSANDWYLPTRDELALVYKNVAQLGLGNFSESTYWTSSEISTGAATDPSNAYVQDFRSSPQYSYSFRNVLNRVRAIRQF